MSSTHSQTSVESSDEKKRSLLVDLRSDTVTKPSPEMRRAMMEAEVGDDVYAEDPTINRLEQRAAEIFGREASIFVPSGTMGNQIAIKIHTRPGQEIICEERAHIKDYEMAMLAHFSGCIPRTIAGENGVMTWEQVRRKIQPSTYYIAQTGLVSLENTHNMAGGTVTPTEIVDEICEGVHKAGLPVHLDGARIFNASLALGKPVAQITRNVDSVMFCLSKGLGAPVGSLLVGSREFIRQARIYRKALGGGMRQAGILAAAGLIALEQGPKRLQQDHDNAKFIAERLSKTPKIEINPATVQTNILVFDISRTGMTSTEFNRRLAEKNVLANTVTPEIMRLVTHLDVDRAACQYAVQAIEEICA